MDTEVTKAMVLAAGEGTRLRPLTLEMPKALLPVGGVPMIYHTLSWLKHHGMREVAINLYHLGDKVSDCLGDGSSFGLKIVYSPEEAPLGTAGGVKRIERFFDGTFIVVYGDVLTDFNLSAMLEFHQEKKGSATLALLEVSNTSDLGIVQITQDQRVVDFVEKPPKGMAPGNLASGGIYVLEKEILEHIPGSGFYDFAYDVFPGLIEAGLPIYGYILGSEDYLIDIGTPENYRQANDDMKDGQLRISYGQKSGIPG